MTDEQNQNQNPDQTPSWYIEEGKPGQGERPAWLPEKFKSAADMAKAHSELEKKLGTAPDNYDFTKSKFIDPDFDAFKDLQKLAKEKRVPAEFMDKMLESIDRYVDTYTPKREEEIKKLGENAEERINILQNWAKANLSKESFEVLMDRIDNASSVKALEELRNKMMTNNNVQVPNNNGEVSTSGSVDDLKKELANNMNKYQDDEAYRKDWQARLEMAAKNTPGYVDKVGS